MSFLQQRFRVIPIGIVGVAHHCWGDVCHTDQFGCHRAIVNKSRGVVAVRRGAAIHAPGDGSTRVGVHSAPAADCSAIPLTGGSAQDVGFV